MDLKRACGCCRPTTLSDGSTAKILFVSRDIDGREETSLRVRGVFRQSCVVQPITSAVFGERSREVGSGELDSLEGPRALFKLNANS